MQGYHEIFLPDELSEATVLLAAAGLDLPEGIDYGLGYYEDSVLLGTAFLCGRVICGVCVNPERQGEGLAAALAGRVLAVGVEKGHSKLLLFTKPGEVERFASLGLECVAVGHGAALLEWGAPSCTAWLGQIRAQLPSGGALGCLVLNANPFTLGHRHLVTTALAACPRLVIFVVEEDASVFPFTVRFELVRQGVAGLPGVAVLPGGPYMVSRASFPAYFTGRSGQAAAHADLDCTIFASRIAPALGITHRFVGEEPYCEVTAAYNEALREILPRHGVGCTIVPRLAHAGQAVSASSVREILRHGQDEAVWQALAALVPPTTLAFLRSDAAEAIRRNIQGKASRH